MARVVAQKAAPVKPPMWIPVFLKSIGAPVTHANAAFLASWWHREGGALTNNAKFNWLNTTHGNYPSMNSTGVKVFPDFQTGISVLKDVFLGGYPNLTAALRSGKVDLRNPGVQGDINRWLSGNRSPGMTPYIQGIASGMGAVPPFRASGGQTPQQGVPGRQEASGGVTEASPAPSLIAPNLGPMPGFSGAGVSLKELPGIPNISQVVIDEPKFRQVVEHGPNGKPWQPTPQQMKQVVGGTVHGNWKYPAMDPGVVPAKFSNLSFAGHTDMVHVDTTLLAKMNQLGKLLGVKVDVISGYRAPGYSSRVGGYSNDPHARGVAVDAYINGKPVGDYPGAVAILKRLGLESGAQANFYHGQSDPEHVQIPGSGMNKRIHAKHTLR